METPQSLKITCACLFLVVTSATKSFRKEIVPLLSFSRSAISFNYSLPFVGYFLPTTLGYSINLSNQFLILFFKFLSFFFLFFCALAICEKSSLRESRSEGPLQLLRNVDIIASKPLNTPQTVARCLPLIMLTWKFMPLGTQGC